MVRHRGVSCGEIDLEHGRSCSWLLPGEAKPHMLPLTAIYLQHLDESSLVETRNAARNGKRVAYCYVGPSTSPMVTKTSTAMHKL